MPDQDLANFQEQLAKLREEVDSQLAALRREVAAMLENGAESGVLRAKIAEWERRETALGEKLAARNVEYQALRARAELDSYRQQLRVGDLEKQLALRETETAKLRSILEALSAEHAECGRRQSAVSQGQADPVDMVIPEAIADSEEMAELRGQLQFSREECARLQASIENSVALRLARSIPRLLGPLRGIFAKGEQR
jgi:chromosome segregation ATPase